MYFALNNIRSGWNVGSAFRTADSLGAKLILVGYTASPNSKTLKIINKTAIGSEQNVEWEKCSHFQEIFAKYSISDNFQHFAIEISKASQNLIDFIKIHRTQIDLDKTILWFGNEIHGIENDLLRSCQAELHLPMLGKKESLNIASSLAVAGYFFKFG